MRQSLFQLIIESMLVTAILVSLYISLTAVNNANDGRIQSVVNQLVNNKANANK